MFSKADPHKQLFQLLLTIQGLRKNLLYEIMMQTAWEIEKYFVMRPLVSLKIKSEKQEQKLFSYWWHITTQIWVVLLIGWSKFLMQQNQSEEEFLRSFVRCHFTGVATCWLFSEAMKQNIDL